MSEKLGQDLAFPCEVTYNENGFHGVQTGNHSGFETGMNKRFYAACAAMQGILANRELQIAIYADSVSKNFNPSNLQPDELLIKCCYDYADELLKQENNG